MAAILQKFYIYDPCAGEEFGGLRIKTDDEGGNPFVLAPQGSMQYWIDQGMAGMKPVGEVGDKAKKLLAQLTRGRSEDADARPRRVPRYSKKTQSGAPAFAATSAMRIKRRRTKKKGDDRTKHATKQQQAAPQPKPPLPPRPVAPPPV
jgi:hypothetical protein